jgi:hypothetical protein
MQHRFRCIWLAATVLATALGGVATPASAAIRVVISDGTNSQVFYSSDDAAPFFTTSLGTYDLVAGASFSNFSSQSASGASLSQSLLFGDSLPSGMLPTLRVTASVIDAVAGVSNGQVTGANQALVLGAALARFTLPNTPQLNVTSDVDSNASSMVGTVQNNSTVNGSVVSSLAIPVDALNPPDAQQAGTVGNNPGLGFTLVSEIVVSGVTSGIMGSLGSTTTVTALTPEPGPLALWGLGALGIVASAAGGRFRRLARH